ncbi:MAG: DUF4026 domain-containing protein [Planctomycetota bacterium]
MLPQTLNTNQRCYGTVVCQPGSSVSPESFAQLSKRGWQVGGTFEQSGDVISVKSGSRNISAAVKLTEPTPHFLTGLHAPGLTGEDIRRLEGATSAVAVALDGQSNNVLRDRKTLLEILRDVAASVSGVAIDDACHRAWTMDELDEELAHDAELDIEQLYVVHGVYDDNAPRRNADGRVGVDWAHTHGLAELGAFDFDILRMHPDCQSGEAFRAIATMILYGEIAPDSKGVTFAHPGRPVDFVPAVDFHAGAKPADAAFRHLDEFHTENRSVVCEPVRKRLFGKPRPTPSKYFESATPDNSVVRYSKDATGLAAKRAQDSLPSLRPWVELSEELGLGCLVKLGYETDSDPSAREYLWFIAEKVTGSHIVATLINRPYDVGHLAEGQRGEHDLERLADWTVITPFGHGSPRSPGPLILCKRHIDELRSAASEAAADQPHN